MRAMPTIRRLAGRLRSRRAERRRTRGERALKRNEAKAQRLRHERFDDKAGPMGPGI
jgi:hypothetical protein